MFHWLFQCCEEICYLHSCWVTAIAVKCQFSAFISVCSMQETHHAQTFQYRISIMQCSTRNCEIPRLTVISFLSDLSIALNQFITFSHVNLLNCCHRLSTSFLITYINFSWFTIWLFLALAMWQYLHQHGYYHLLWISIGGTPSAIKKAITCCLKLSDECLLQASILGRITTQPFLKATSLQQKLTNELKNIS